MESLIEVVRRAQKEQQDDLELLRVLKAQLANLQLEMSTLITENAPKEPSAKQEAQKARTQPPCAAPPKVTQTPSADSSSVTTNFSVEHSVVDRDDELWDSITSSPLMRKLWACMPMEDPLVGQDIIPPSFLPRAKKAMAMLKQQPFWSTRLPSGWSDFLLEVFDINTHLWSTPWSAQCKNFFPLDFAFSPFHIEGRAPNFRVALSSKGCFVRTDLHPFPSRLHLVICLKIRLGDWTNLR